MKIAKYIIILANLIIIGIAWKWYTPENWEEPAIVIVGQLISLITLSFDQYKGKTINTDTDNMDLDVDTEGHADVENTRVKNSRINIKKR